MDKIDAWLMVHEKNGVTASRLGEDLDIMMRNMFRRYAMMTLGYKVTSNLLNMTAAFSSAIEIGVNPFLKLAVLSICCHAALCYSREWALPASGQRPAIYSETG
jgi:hypothetical protein